MKSSAILFLTITNALLRHEIIDVKVGVKVIDLFDLHSELIESQCNIAA